MLTGAAVSLILAGLPLPAGAAVAAAGGALLLSARWSRSSGRLAFAGAAVERLADAAMLGSIAWVALSDRPVVAAAALVALSSSYLASYLRSKAEGLGFSVQDRRPVRLAGWGVVALGLVIPPALVAALWAAAGLWLVVVVMEVRDVALEGEPR